MAVAGLLAFALIGALAVKLEQAGVRQQATEVARRSVGSVRDSVAAAVWQMDQQSLALLLAPLVREGSIARVQVMDGESLIAEATRTGPPPRHLAEPWSLPLLAGAPPRPLAELRVVESYDDHETRLTERLWTLLPAEALKIALVAALVLWLLNRQFVRPLNRLGQDLSALQIDQPDRQLVLQRPSPREPDELDQLVASINRMHHRLMAELGRRVQAEKRESERAAEQAQILSLLTEGVVAFDRRGAPLYANAAAMRLMALPAGWPAVPAAVMRADERAFWSGEAAALKAQCRATQAPALRRLYLNWRLPDGRDVPLELTLTGLPKGPLGFLMVARDVSSEQLAEQAQAETRAARAADRAKSEFLSHMSHELRTPLHAVQGLSQLLLADPLDKLSPRQAELVGHVDRAGQHLLSLISDLLDMSRIEAGTMRLHQRTVNLVPLVSDAVHMMEPTARARGLQLHFEQLSSGPLWAALDETRFKQVLMNLLSNAVKYNRDGGEIRVGVALCSAGRLQVTVADSGLGMTDSQMQRLFTPFSRVGREHSGVEGTGIGLVIARQLTQLMGGTLVCSSSRWGEGSVFVIELPLATAPSGRQTDAEPAAPQPVSVRDDVTGCIVVAEDNEVNRLLVELYMRYRPGVQLHGADDVAATVALVARHAPQLALIDMNLGSDSGHDVLAQVRALPRGEATRCVAFSADAMPEQIQAALQAGFDDYWVKPISLELFLQKLDAALVAAAAPA